MPGEPIPRNVPRRVARARGAVGGLAKTNAPHEAIEAARVALAEANAEAAVRKIVDGWPPLSAETKAELACIILSGGDHTAT